MMRQDHRADRDAQLARARAIWQRSPALYCKLAQDVAEWAEMEPAMHRLHRRGLARRILAAAGAGQPGGSAA